MFGKKKNRKAPADIPETEDRETETRWTGRIHAEGLGHVWRALTGIDAASLIPQIVGTVLHEGGTRPPWRWKKDGREYILMAWPEDQPIRAAVLMAGPDGGQLKPLTVVPLAQGLPNDLTVEEIHQRQEGGCGDVGVMMLAGKNPMWFFDPLFGRDLADLTPGVTHTFWLAGIALGLRKALLDEIAITHGPQFDAWAQDWLSKNPQAKRHEIPPLKINVAGKPMIMPGHVFGEYQLRTTIEKIEDFQLEKMPVKVLHLNFPFDDRPGLHLPLYASQAVLHDYTPEIGQEIEAYAWLEGRIIDLEQPEAAVDAKE